VPRVNRNWVRGAEHLLLALVLACTAYTQAGANDTAEREGPLGPDPSGIENEDAAGISLREDGRQIAYTSRFLFHRLFHVPTRASSYWTIGGILGASAVLGHNKYSVQREFLEIDGEESDEISATAKLLGNAGTVPAAGLALLLHGLAFRSPRTHETGLMVMESALYTSLFTGLGQFVFSEERPPDGGDLEFFRRGGHGVSGHASIAASIAAPLSRGLFRIDSDDGRWARFGKRFGKVLAYGVPTLTGLSRIHDDRHYAWNVLLGLGIGYAVGDTVADAHDSYHDDTRPGWAPDSFGVLATESGTGLGMSWRF